MKGTTISAFCKSWMSGRQSWFWFTIWVRTEEDPVPEASTWHPHKDNCCPSGKENSDKSQVSLFQLCLGLEWPSGRSGSTGPTVIKACTRLSLLPDTHTTLLEKWGYGDNLDPWLITINTDYVFQSLWHLLLLLTCSLWSCRNLLMSVLPSYNGALERAWYFPFPQRMDKSPLGEELRKLLLNILLLCCRVLLHSILSTLHNIGLLSHHYSLYGTLYNAYLALTMELPLAQMVKTLPTVQNTRVWSEKIPWRRKWQPTPGFLPEKSHGQRSLAGYI